MEVAFFLGLWGGALGAFLDHERRPSLRGALVLGAWSAALVTTRPEATTTVLAFGLFAAFPAPPRRAAWTLATIGAPAVALLLVQSLANRAFTGEWSANGALVKLALNNPFLTPAEKLADYTFNLKYSVLRVVEYHLADVPAVGWILPALAATSLLVPRTRKVGALVWCQIIGWLALVAANGQVRWQNERYLMPAVAWMLVAAALGVSGLLRRRERPSIVLGAFLGPAAAQAIAVALRPAGQNPELRGPLLAILGVTLLGAAVVPALLAWFPLRALVVLAALFASHEHQAKNLRGQKWFFGRASRNIRDQHVTAGRYLKTLAPKRILVGDAGAILYAAERPGLDIIGLGGFHDLPFARAGVQGLPATLELIERMPAADLPDVFAIYPTWWGVLPTWFSRGVLARFPVEGNVICGGYEKVVYAADWHVLGTGARPRGAPAGERIVDEIDVADLVSERAHRYVFPTPGGGWTEMKILDDPKAPGRDLFDAGRRIAAGRAERFVASGLTTGSPRDARLPHRAGNDDARPRAHRWHPGRDPRHPAGRSLAGARDSFRGRGRSRRGRDHERRPRRLRRLPRVDHLGREPLSPRSALFPHRPSPIVLP